MAAARDFCPVRFIDQDCCLWIVFIMINHFPIRILFWILVSLAIDTTMVCHSFLHHLHAITDLCADVRDPAAPSAFRSHYTIHENAVVKQCASGIAGKSLLRSAYNIIFINCTPIALIAIVWVQDCLVWNVWRHC